MLSIINIIFLNNLKNVIKYWINVKKKLLLISRLTKHIFSLFNFNFDMFFAFFFNIFWKYNRYCLINYMKNKGNIKK